MSDEMWATIDSLIERIRRLEVRLGDLEHSQLQDVKNEVYDVRSVLRRIEGRLNDLEHKVRYGV